MTSYTLRYGKTYEEWAEEKAKRIYNALKYYYGKKEPARLKDFAFQVYRERLLGVSLIKWKPVFEIFTDFKPSPFIKNFIKYVFDELKYAGYIKTYFTVEIYDITCVNDIKLDIIKISFQPPQHYTVEVKDTVTVRDTPRPEKTIPQTKITRMDMVEHLPPYEFIKNLCYWKDPL